MGRNNNLIAHRRDDRLYQIFRAGWKATAAQIQRAIPEFASEERVRRRLRNLEGRRKVRLLGWYEDYGKRVKVWGFGNPGPHLDHDVELFDIALSLTVEDVLVGKRIPLAWRKEWDNDYAVLVDGKTFIGEHDRGHLGRDQIAARMRKLERCPFPVLWTCPDAQRMRDLIDAAPNERHWFTLFPIGNPHSDIWQNNHGAVASIPERPAVQLDVQLHPSGEPLRVQE